ncbi:MAG: hypothetical protein IT342_02360 [Candidatus Melainabacteria bacterium]|nr:hypothetical protein [Candidatus Melainabacteria bacterium]
MRLPLFGSGVTMDFLQHEIEYHRCQFGAGILTVRSAVNFRLGLTILILLLTQSTSITAQAHQNRVPGAL